MEKAICWASGLIEVAATVPENALLLAAGPAPVLEEAIQGNARLAYDGKTWLVPGVPEASDEIAAVDAAIIFATRLKNRVRQLRCKRAED